MREKIKDNRLNIILEVIFIIFNVYILYCYLISDMIKLEGYIRFMLVIISIIANFILFVYRIHNFDEINTDKIFFWSFIFTEFYNISLGYLIAEKTLIDSVGVLILLSTIYRVYDMYYYGDITPFSNITLFLIFVVLIVGFTFIDDQIYNIILAIATFLIGTIDEKSLDTVYDLGMSDKDIIFDKRKFLLDKFSLLKIVMSIYPAIFISNILLSNFSTIIGISESLSNYPDKIVFSEIRVAIFAVDLLVIDIIFKDDRVKKFINDNYIVKLDPEKENLNNDEICENSGENSINETSHNSKNEALTQNSRKFIGISLVLFVVYSIIRRFMGKSD